MSDDRSKMVAMASLEVTVKMPLDRFELDVSFATTHQVTGIFGVSGSGKTSLLEVIAGIRVDARGRIQQGDQRWLDTDAGQLTRSEDRQIGYVPQDGLLFPHLNVRRNLLSGCARAEARGVKVDEIFRTVTELLELSPLLDRQIEMLSGGERQRVALGRAICSGPSLLLLDEPLAALDMSLRRRLLPFLRRLNEEFSIPSIMVSHDPVELQALCGDLIVLREGRVIARGRPDDVLTDGAVYSVAEHGYENVLPGERLAGVVGAGRLRLVGADPLIELAVGSSDAPPGTRVYLGLPARDIMISRDRPALISARNIIPAKIVALRSLRSAELVTVSLGASTLELRVEVTSTTIETLDLEVGGQVFLIFKATSCRVYGESVQP